jgi:hypothetical protein
MAIKGTEKDSIHSLKGLKPESTVDNHKPAKTEPRFGTGLRKVPKSTLSLKGQIPPKYNDNLPI